MVLTGKSIRLIGLGDFGVAAEAARRLGADLDTLAGRRLPARLEAVVKESIRHQTEVLTAEVTAPLAPAARRRGRRHRARRAAGVRSVEPGPRAARATGHRMPVGGVVAERGGAAAPPSGPCRSEGAPPLLVAGPDLAHAAAEVTAIAKIYPGTRPLLAESATVSAALLGLDGCPLAHLAAHGHDERENFLFSRLDLADGPLMAYDVQQLAAPPGQVILSACDVGRSVVRPGEELLGFTAALLYIGTATVIASVARVADEAAVGIMTAYHQRLAAGIGPAGALAEAGAAEPFSPFVCFGSG